MNQRDRDRLARLRRYVLAVPFPRDGVCASAAALRGLVEYQREMRRVLPLCGDCVTAIARCDVEDPDSVLDELAAALRALGHLRGDE